MLSAGSPNPRGVLETRLAMHYDDRLGTVLRARVEGANVARIQYRQLLDLLGTRPVEGSGDQLDAAYQRLDELNRSIPAADRAAIIGEPGLRLRSPRLIAELAGETPQIAEAAIRQAQLGSEQWLDLIPALPLAARGVVRRRQDLEAPVEKLLGQLGIAERGLPPAGPVIEGEAAIAEPAQFAAGTGIGAIVKRIEAYRKAREMPAAANTNDSPRLPLGEEHLVQMPAQAACFNFACDGAGRVVWADPGVAPMVVGTPLVGDATLGSRSALFAAIRRHQPLTAVTLNLTGAAAIAGEWQADAAPQFDPLTGQFSGYLGRMRRAVGAGPADATIALSAAEREADRIRELLHELRTPVGAIQGFAEVIQQQLFGPAPHEYRALAANVAGDAARVLAAFEELERYAKLESAALKVEPGECDLAELVAQTVARIAPIASQRGSGFDARYRKGDLTVAIAAIEAERIVWRLLATLAGTAAPGETLPLRLTSKSGGAKLKVTLPALLAQRDDKALFGAAVGAVPQTIASGMFGIGFALRLAQSEARSAGGALERDGNELILWLPGLDRTGAAPYVSEGQG